MSDEVKEGQSKEAQLAGRIDSVGWALFLIMIGCLWLVPAESVPESTWLVGAGLIMIGVNLVKRSAGLTMNPFTIGVGVIAIGLAVAGFLSVELPFFAILLIIIGANITIRLITESGRK